MPFQPVNLGAAPKDGTGDNLRAGGTKINSNFKELYEGTHIAEAVDAVVPSDTDRLGVRQGGGHRGLTFAILWNWILQKLLGHTNKSVAATGAVSLSLSEHNNRVVTLNAPATLTIDWARTGDGFSCVLINLTGDDVTPILVGFSSDTVVNASNLTTIRANGMVGILAYSPDGGSTKICRVGGEMV